ncbi:hypothetical protein [Bacillus subtilis]|uniref:hypothetical protein n=1 Tax=Bacillus subtilis TaxID=1423 RepID=UPI0013D16CA2|nr:hypothetical protein [Bacillus subtilis]MCM3007253.1 hypothetical protein [Bacillus subtilis]MDK8208752.1 hypothetical protein [Bacillus subtilis]WEY87576.1 hypothetical protein P5628_15250 [Bacillus subtilis]WEZ18891.1 hypothetical protein P5661_15950 [Bacillus subtilis]
MAQIIKIHDYISRYELDPYHYINQFVRLKKERWLSLVEAAERQHEERQASTEEPEPVQKRKKFSLKRRKEEIKADIQEERHQWFEDEEDIHVRLPKSRVALASFYKRHLYDFQLKWASSTLSEISQLSNQVKQDRILRYLTQQLPDSYFIMYKPVLKIQQAAVELSIVIISPLEIYCVSFLEAEEDSVYIGSKNRFWDKKTASQTASVLNPGLSLFRTDSVVSKIVKEKQAEIPVRKLLLSRTSYIDYPEPPYGLEIADKRSAEEWIERQKKNTAPIKHHQVKAAKALLSYCMSDSYRRQEWLE